jgi:hypothetical protein
MILATLMAVRAFPTRPASAGALCGMSAGIRTLVEPGEELMKYLGRWRPDSLQLWFGNVAILHLGRRDQRFEP